MPDKILCGKCGHLMEDLSVEHEPAHEQRHDVQPARRRRWFKCPECGAEKTVADIAPEGEVEAWENEGGSAWGKDEGPWEG